MKTIPSAIIAVALLTTGTAFAGADDPGPYDAYRTLTIEDAEALIAPICPGFRYPPGTDWREARRTTKWGDPDG